MESAYLAETVEQPTQYVVAAVPGCAAHLTANAHAATKYQSRDACLKACAVFEYIGLPRLNPVEHGFVPAPTKHEAFMQSLRFLLLSNGFWFDELKQDREAALLDGYRKAFEKLKGGA